MNQMEIKAYVERCYGSIRYETNYGLHRVIFNLNFERDGLEENSLKYQLLSAKIDMASDELDKRSYRKYQGKGN
jgi:hypothetical protein